MRSAFTLLGFLVLASFAVSCAPDFSTQTSEEWGTFVSEEHQFAIDYPPQWRGEPAEDVRSNDDQLVAVFWTRKERAVNADASVTIAYQTMPSPSVADVAKWGEMRIDDFYESYELDEFYQHTVSSSSESALARTYRANIESPKTLQLTDVYLTFGDQGFIITLTTTETEHNEFAPLFNQMVASFEFLE